MTLISLYVINKEDNFYLVIFLLLLRGVCISDFLRQ